MLYRRRDIKRLFAYSSIEHMGIIVFAFGIGGPLANFAGLLHMVMHSLTKSAIFFAVGNVTQIKGTQKLAEIRGLTQSHPALGWGLVLAVLSIAGMPPFVGFWAKDGVLAAAFFDHSYVVWAIGLAAAAFTGFYMTRETLLVFGGNERFRIAEGAEPPAEPEVTASPTVDYGTPVAPAHLAHDPHEGARTMVLPVLALATLAIIGGLLELPFTNLEFLSDWLDPVFEGTHPANPTSFVAGLSLSLLAVAVGLIGITGAYLIYRRGLEDPAVDPGNERLGVLGRLFGRAWYYDDGIAALVGGPIRRAAQWLADVFDPKVIDGAVNGVARGFGAAGGAARRVQTGFVRQYALGIVIGLVAFVVWIIVRVGI